MQAGHASAQDAANLANHGVALKAAGRIGEAVAAYERAISIAPRDGNLHYLIGNAMLALGRADEAEAAYRRAIACGNCRDGGAMAYANLGQVLEARDAFAEAIAANQEAIRRRSDIPEYHYNLGNALRASLRLDKAVAAYDRAIALRPDYADARLNQSFARLLRGDFQRGWDGFEWRQRTNEVDQRGFAEPEWAGMGEFNVHVLLYAEQGHGDTIQCLRYLPLLAGFAGTITVEVQPALRRLVENNLPRAGRANFKVLGRGEVLPRFDRHLSLMSLHRLFRVGLPDIPGAAPYLRADPNAAAHWREKLACADGLKVGLVWAGAPGHRNDRNRSMPAAALRPLIEAGRAWARKPHFFSLQFGPVAHDLFGLGGLVTDLSPELSDFADTAAVLSALDLLVCVDTSVAHLAGALGKPVRLLLPWAPDWRWLLDRPDSPWYPSLRLHRQQWPGDWSGVVAEVAAELGAAASN